MAVKLTAATTKKWLADFMPEKFHKEFSADELDVISHSLVYADQYEEYLHLHFRSGAIVISLGRPNADEKIFLHYAERGIREYRKYISKEPLPGYELPLRITWVGFATPADPEASVPMPEGMHAKLVPAAKKSDDVAFEFVNAGEGRVLMCFAWRNVNKRYFLYRLAGACRRHGLGLGEVRFAYLNSLSADCVLIGTIELEGTNVGDAIEMKRFIREFELLRTFVGFDQFVDLVEEHTITGNQANLLRALSALIEQCLTEVNPALYTLENIREAFCFHPALTVDFIKMFKARFHPRIHDATRYAELKKDLLDKLVHLDTGRKKHDDRRRAVFRMAIVLSDYILKTNAYSYRKLGIGFRINPEYLDHIEGFDRKAKFPEVPYGLFFVHGGNYMGIQIRFRDLSRGGMRTVISWDREHERYERPNMFAECYNLAFTQQKKNKDIPEGGSKSVIFLNANTDLAKELDIARREMKTAGGMDDAQIEAAIAKLEKDLTLEYMYSNQRCFLTTLLTLFVWDFDRNCLKYGENVVDHLGVPEYIYLGPDENFHDYLIEWLAHKSTEMGNFSRGAFISGKEETGVNHKEFGVTTWGCLQYLHHAIKFVGLDDKFTVKLTGGPDGDVAGNFIRLLHKYYPTRAQLVMITDASGTCYDPEGFEFEAMLEMFHKVQPIAMYPFEKLHEGAWILCLKRTRKVSPLTVEVLRVSKKDGKIVEEWIPSSTAFHIFGTNAHSTVTDVFLPCGGRPRALNMNNIQDFYVDGKPSCKVIVEGANLYITQDAREKLEDDGVLLFRDSSANKCGVISSSYEILGGLILEDEEFVKIKPELAKNILERLEKVANAEAVCMIRYYVDHDRKVRMTAVSELVSQKINKFTDDLAAYLAPLDIMAPEHKALLDIFINYIPACIRKDFLDRAMKRVPDSHKKAIIATHIACDLVYNRGLSWWPSVPDILPLLLKQ